jgi:hypothetical protein
VVDATGEVIFKHDRVNTIFVIELIMTHEDIGERGGCEGERNDGLAEHCFSTVEGAVVKRVWGACEKQEYVQMILKLRTKERWVVAKG